MNEQKPSVGRVVIYTPTKQETEFLRDHGCNHSTALPATIVSVWGDTPQSAFNVKVHVDGPAADLWKTSLTIDAGTPDAENEGKVIYREGSCHWPPRV